ncbi:hypothetical protein [Streptomyces sp. NPDC047009]|uniref:hypothetical protein n=1 Tax=Streptomyces sp. NPDC047009 TaxID=3154496 RepID=UPI0033E3FFD8
MREPRILVDSRADLTRRRTMAINQIKAYTHLWRLTRKPGMTSLTALLGTTDLSAHIRRVLIEMITEIDELN